MKQIVVLLVWIIAGVSAMAQNPSAAPTGPSSPFQSGGGFSLGGNIGLQFGDITAIDLSPTVAYNITERWQIGTGVTYQYIRDKQLAISLNMYGGRLFTRYYILENIFAQSEYELLGVSLKDDSGNHENYTLEALYLGGGIRQQLGGNSNLIITGLWNVLDGRYARENPVIRVGFEFGL